MENLHSIMLRTTKFLKLLEELTKRLPMFKLGRETSSQWLNLGNLSIQLMPKRFPLKE